MEGKRSEKAKQLIICLHAEKEKKKNCRPLAVERPAAAMLVFPVPSTRTFRAKVVYMVLG